MTPANARPERAAGGGSEELDAGTATDRPAPARVPAPGETPELAAGQLRTHTRLGATAVYRVLEWDEELVRVEVVTAPGLDSGMTLSLTREAVGSMPVEGE
jgi:hypothetical protein